jgi:hypothetical protein
MKRTLTETTLVQLFGQLPLKARRELMPDLMASARIITKFTIPECSDTVKKFTQWLFSGEYSEWPDNKIIEAWELFNFLYKRTTYGASWTVDKSTWDISSNVDHIHRPEDDGGIAFVDKEGGYVTRKEYFNLVLQVSPEQLCVYNGSGGRTEREFDYLVMEFTYDERMEWMQGQGEWDRDVADMEWIPNFHK